MSANQTTALEPVSTATTATAVLYLRVSTPSQVNKAIDPEGYSIPVQRDAMERRAAALEAEKIGEYIEPGRTATNMKRPALQQLLADLPKLKPTYVIVYDLSRIVREEFDAHWLLREVTASGATLISVLEPFDNSATGMLTYGMFASINAFFSRRDGEKVKEGLRRKFLAGGAMGPARIGYLNAKKLYEGREVAVIEVDPDREQHVRMAFDLYATGNYTLATLTELLDVAGLRTRETLKKPSRPMSRSSVHRMLGDDFYVGTVTLNGDKIRGLHDPLIDEATFERVQRILAGHKASGDRSHKHQHYLIGEIFCCDECDRRIGYGQHRGNGGRYEYFSCLSRMTKGGRCGAPYMRVDEVEQAMVDYQATIIYTDEEQDRLRQVVREFIEPRVQQARKQAELHQRRLRELQGEQQKLVQMAYKGLVDEDVLVSEQERIKTERAEARRWVELSTHEVADVMDALKDALALVDKTLPYADADPIQRRILNQATHVRLAPFVDENSENPRACSIHGQRDPFYVEADLWVGKTPAELKRGPHGPYVGQEVPEMTMASIYRGHGSDKTRMAERAGFEPAKGYEPLTRLAGECLQPLGHLSRGEPV
jgi:site-specific DNA recombinase